MASVEPSLAGPRRPQDKIFLANAAKQFIEKDFPDFAKTRFDKDKRHAVANSNFDLGHGDVTIAAITSCTNTSNPSVMLAAGLVAQKAVEKGLTTKPWVKTSLAPGSQVVTDYLEKAGLNTALDALGFNLVGYGCTTCIGNSGPLADNIAKVVEEHDLVVCSVLSGNRNLKGASILTLKLIILPPPHWLWRMPWLGICRLI
jgi:aconitate hydratase